MTSMNRLRQLVVAHIEQGNIGNSSMLEVMAVLNKLLDVAGAAEQVEKHLNVLETNYDNPDGSAPLIMGYTTYQVEDIKLLRDALAALRRD